MPKHKNPRLPPATWAEIRGMYESGEYASLEKLHASIVDKWINRRYPALRTLELRAALEVWDRYKNREKQQAIRERSWLDTFEKVGINDAVVARRIADGINHADVMMGVVIDKIKECGGTIDPLVAKALQRAVEDLHVVIKYIAEYNKLTGAYPDAGKTDKKPTSLSINIGLETLEEKMVEHERLLKLLKE